MLLNDAVQKCCATSDSTQRSGIRILQDVQPEVITIRARSSSVLCGTVELVNIVIYAISKFDEPANSNK
jgi:hypothetical protein